MHLSGSTDQPSGNNVICPACSTVNPAGASLCRNCGRPLLAAPDTSAAGGRTVIIGKVPAAGPAQRPRLVAPHDLDLGALRGSGTVRGKLRIANNGTGLLTGTVRVAPNAPWLTVLGTGEVFCAAGAVESVEVQAQAAGLKAGMYTAAIQLTSDGGQATVQVTLAVERESMVIGVVAAAVTAILVLAVLGLVYASNGGKLPLVAGSATATATATMTATNTATSRPTATFTALPTDTPAATNTPLPPATATTDTAGTATAEAKQAQVAQQLVASARATATALADSGNATATALAVNQSPESADKRLAIESAVNNFLVVRSRALYTGDGSQLSQFATGRELADMQKQLSDLAREGDHTKVNSIEAPVWDSIVLNANDLNQASATLTKHEDELAIRNDTGIADDLDPTYTGTKHTLRNQRYAVTYHLTYVGGKWMVDDYKVYEYPTSLPTPDQNLLPPAVQAPTETVGQNTPTAVPSTTPSDSQLSVEQVVKQALPSVLRITGNIAHNQQSTGTGFVIQTSGSFAYIVTNDHVVNGATGIKLSDQSNVTLPAITVQEDTADDLAVIKIAQPAQPLSALSWGDSDAAQLGENVIAIGFALGLKGEPTVSNGIISALHRDVAVRWPYLQHTAPINHGNSGGPLLDLYGTVIGINTLLDENAQSVYFAIPANPAKQKVADLIGAMP